MASIFCFVGACREHRGVGEQHRHADQGAAGDSGQRQDPVRDRLNDIVARNRVKPP